MAKRREMEELIERLQAQAGQMEKQLAEYRAKEQAIVEALTQAQATAARRVREAEEQARGIVHEAEERREALAAENAEAERTAHERAQAIVADAEAVAKSTVENASDQAQAITQKAREDAEQSLRETEAAVREYTQRLDALNAALREAAAAAREKAQAFAAAVDGLILPQEETLPDTAGLGIHALIKQSEPLPEEYDSPAQLMHSILKLQGREAPQPETAPQEAPQPESAPQEAPQPESAPQAPAFPAQHLPAQPPEADPQTQPDEERLWTVDEVIAAAPKQAEAPAPPVDLDALLEDIMKE